MTLDGKIYHEGDWISIDGSTGKIYGEAIPTVEATISGDFGRFMAWADAARKLKVRTNADNPRDAAQAVEVRRGRHRPVPYRAHVLRGRPHQGRARDDRCPRPSKRRKTALAKLLPYQQGDFEAMYQRAGGPSR